MKLKKLLLWSIVTAVLIGIVVWIGSLIIPYSYVEWSFFIGVGLTAVLLFFSSSGGFLSGGLTFEASQAVGRVEKNEGFKAYIGVLFYGASLYTVVSLVMTIAIYI
ncbi:hypothetical protein [Jeotgalibacillus terrae]|uniref:Uncharacterized protein n=1 Tax=Jeotgalibacillus terrae TaxID=587735 RepID=A0ABW5ZII4_9BACL|nr:hypothetical protein [Jeotgalibacillus terrae]MBM7579671.1 hypothetical protein [Jeotgalibacillus terrae]